MLGFLLALQRGAKNLLHHLLSSALFHWSKKAKPLRNLRSRLDQATTGAAINFAAMEVSNQFKLVFEVIDENGDGKISPSELSQVLLCLGYKESVAKAEAEGMVRELDCNGDGFVDLDEFMNAVATNNVGSAEKSISGSAINATKEVHDHLMEAFLVFDADRNGKISAKELRRVLVKLGCDKCSLGECRRMIKAVDMDGDGFVDFEEFRLMMTKEMLV